MSSKHTISSVRHEKNGDPSLRLRTLYVNTRCSYYFLIIAYTFQLNSSEASTLSGFLYTTLYTDFNLPGTRYVFERRA